MTISIASPARAQTTRDETERDAGFCRARSRLLPLRGERRRAGRGACDGDNEDDDVWPRGRGARLHSSARTAAG